MITQNYNLIMAFVARLSARDDGHDILDEEKNRYVNVMELLNGDTHPNRDDFVVNFVVESDM